MSGAEFTEPFVHVRSLILLDVSGAANNPRSEVIEIRAVALSWPELCVRSPGFHQLVRFDEGEANPKHLVLNNYEPEVWKREAISAFDAASKLDEYIGPFREHRVTTNSGRVFHTAWATGHNISSMDLPLLRTLYRKLRRPSPFDHIMLDTAHFLAWSGLLDDSHVPAENGLRFAMRTTMGVNEWSQTSRNSRLDAKLSLLKLARDKMRRNG